MNSDSFDSKLIIALVGALGTIGVLVRAIVSYTRGDTHGVRERIREEQRENAEREHQRLDREIREVEARMVKTMEITDEREAALWAKQHADFEIVRQRLHVMANEINKVAVIDERTKHIAADLERLEATQHRMVDKIDLLIMRGSKE